MLGISICTVPILAETGDSRIWISSKLDSPDAVINISRLLYLLAIQFVEHYSSTRCPFYRVPVQGSFIAWNACIRRYIMWRFPYLATPSRRLSVPWDTIYAVKAFNAGGRASVLVIAPNPRFMHNFSKCCIISAFRCKWHRGILHCWIY